MNSTLCTSLTNASNVLYEPNELVRGHEVQLLAALLAAARQRDLALDLSRVQRIDAAGISALLSLYTAAIESGHRFRIVNPSRRVSGMLGLVGLMPVLTCRNPGVGPLRQPCDCVRNAA